MTTQSNIKWKRMTYILVMKSYKSEQTMGGGREGIRRTAGIQMSHRRHDYLIMKKQTERRDREPLGSPSQIFEVIKKHLLLFSVQEASQEIPVTVSEE